MRYFICLVFVLLSACGSNSTNLALGTLERDRIAHTATTNEIVVELPVRQGSLVKKGTVLVKLDDTLQRAEANKAEAGVARAEANLAKLRSGARVEELAAARAKVAAANAVVIESQATYGRSLTLLKKQVISQASLDSAQAERDGSRAHLQSAQEELAELVAGTREEELRMAEAELNTAIAVLASENKKLADLTIVATRDGILDTLPWNLGERVTTGSPVAILLAGKAPYARIYVPETYRVNMRVGDELVVHVDGLEKPRLGTLRWIATEPAFTPYYALNQEERSRLVYLAEVQLPDIEAHLPGGVPAQVEMP